MKTDRQLQTNVTDELKPGPAVHAEQMSVEAPDGVVTLTGAVNRWFERDVARESAWGAPGVMSVDDKNTIAF